MRLAVLWARFKEATGLKTSRTKSDKGLSCLNTQVILCYTMWIFTYLSLLKESQLPVQKLHLFTDSSLFKQDFFSATLAISIHSSLLWYFALEAFLFSFYFPQWKMYLAVQRKPIQDEDAWRRYCQYVERKPRQEVLHYLLQWNAVLNNTVSISIYRALR